MRNPTIAQQIAQLAADFSVEAAAKLRTRRLTEAQREAVETIVVDNDALSAVYTMAGQLKKYRGGYKATTSASGGKSLNNGDPLAKLLAGKDAMAVMALADVWTPIVKAVPKKGIAIGDLHSHVYANLNEGQKRMNAGNKLRAAIKREELTIVDGGLQKVG